MGSINILIPDYPIELFLCFLIEDLQNFKKEVSQAIACQSY